MNRREFLSVAVSTTMITGAQSPLKRSRGTRRRPPQDQINFIDAVELARLIRSRTLSAVEVMSACLSQVKRINPKVNAICKLLDEDRLLGQARSADERLAKNGAIGPLHGFPHAVKDLVPTAGI